MNKTYTSGKRLLCLFALAGLLILCLTLGLAGCRPAGGPGTESGDPSATENGSPTDPSSDPTTDPGTNSGTDPDTDSGTGTETDPDEPVTIADPETDPVTEEEESLEPIEPWDPWETDPETDPEGETVQPGEPTDPNHPGDSSKYKGLMIAAVYGTGKNNTDASISHGYVQLYNANDYDLRLSGASLYYKTDGAKPYTQLAFPEDAVIPAHGYYLVRANSPAGYDTSNAILSVDAYDLSWDIYIDNKEVRLVLAPSQWLIGTDDDITTFKDAISVFYASETPHVSVYATSKMSKDRVVVRTAMTDYSGYHSVKLSESATAELKKLSTVTSGGTVNPLIASRLNEVVFSHDAGMYTDPIKLTMSAPAGMTIYYTTDGTDPSKSSTRRTYTGAIPLNDSSAMAWGPTIKAWNNASATTMPGGYVIKAYATGASGSTDVYTNTYFVAPALKTYGVSVISLSIPVSEAFGPNGFYSNYCPTGILTDPRPRGFAMMEVFDENGNRVGHSNVELAVSGNGSSGHAMKSLRIYYKGENNMGGGLESDLDYDLFKGKATDSYGQAITSFSRLLLRNSGNDCLDSYVRDAYMQRMCASLRVDSMATATTLVFINGEFWGVYNIRERYSPEYVESHYGVDKENVAVVESDYSQVHTNQCADFVLSSGIEGDQDDFNDLYHFMRDNDLSNPDNYAYVTARMDIDSFIDMWVARLFFVARDWPENNIKVFRNRNPEDPSGMDTKWHFTLLDMDMGLAFYDFTREDENFFWAFGSNSVCGIMMRALINNPDFKNQFILRYYEVVTEIFDPDVLSAQWEALVAERDPLMQLQADRWSYNTGTWANAKNRIRSFIKNRQSYALQHMYSYFHITEQDLNVISAKRLTFSYNEDRTTVLLNDREVPNGQVFRFERDKVRFTVEAEAKEGFIITAIVWNGTNGQSIRKDVNGTSGKKIFTVEGTGTVSVYTKRINADGETPSGGQLLAGSSYIFYLDDHGDLYAWGDNRGGILGLNSDQTIVSMPELVMSNVAKVSTTTSADFENGSQNWMTAILTKDGKLYTVGANGFGQLGRNGTNSDSKLGLVRFNGTIVDVSVGYDHMLILDADGTLWGVGNNSYGQIGQNAGSSSQTFVRVAAHVDRMSAGRRSTIYVDQNGKLYGLGDNRWNKMVAGGPDRLTSPVLLLEHIVFVASGEHQQIAIAEDGTIYYGGWRSLQGFGQGGGNNPAMQKVMDGAVSAAIYFDNLVILTENGDAYVYGGNTGNGIGQTVNTGKPIKFASGVTSVASGFGFTAYLFENGTIQIQGDNSYGQAGNGQIGGSVNMSDVDL